MKNYILNKLTKSHAGLKELPRDMNDVGLSIDSLFGSDYTPKHEKKILPLLFHAKNQAYNTCGWTSSVGAKENIDEKVELDQRFLVIMGKKEGYISGDGFSNLRNNEKILQKYGCCELGLLPRTWKNWADYSDYKYITAEILKNAEQYKSKSYSAITNINLIYKAIDEDRPVKIGIGWRTSMNMSGGFSFPWLLNYIKGWFVGGHAVYIYGYLDYRFKCRNSFGPKYGERGDFYVAKKDLEKDLKKYGAFVNYDLDKDILKWLVSHQNCVVKTEKSPDVFLIQGDKKRKFYDLATLYSWGYSDSDIITVEADYLDDVEESKLLRFWEGKNVKAIKSILLQKKELKKIFSKYFNEFF